MILVVGATGRLGSEVTRLLLAKGFQVRILVRPQSPYQELVEAGAEAVTGDLKEPESLARACSGVEAVMASATAIVRDPPDDLQSVDIAGYRSLIRVAKDAGVGQFVFVSAALADRRSGIPLFRAKGETEAQLVSSDIPYTILAPDMFMESWVRGTVVEPAQRRKAVLLVGEGRTKHSFISRHDVARVVASAVGDPCAIGRRILLGGPAPLSWLEVVSSYESVTGKKPRVRHLALGKPDAGLSEEDKEFVACMEARDTIIDTTGVSRRYGIRLTCVDEYIRRCVAGGD